MKVAILGGSFDPPHLGHILIARQVKEILGLDQVLLIPNFKHAFGKIQSPAKHRLAMTKLLEDDFIKVSESELQRKGISFTIDTLNILESEYPNNKFSGSLEVTN